MMFWKSALLLETIEFVLFVAGRFCGSVIISKGISHNGVIQVINGEIGHLSYISCDSIKVFLRDSHV